MDPLECNGVTRFHVQTSDVLQEVCVNVSLEGSDQVIWHKERFLDDKEIVENIIHNATNTICWTIHRPLRGWSIRIRSPMFPPGVFIPLVPVPSSAAYHSEAALSFSSRTNIPITFPMQSSMTRDSSEFQTERNESKRQHHHTDSDAASSSSSVHSYPPTSSSRPGSLIPSSQITQFVLSPSSIPPAQTADDLTTNTSFFSRAMSALKNHRPSRSNSFTLSRILHPPKTDGISSPPPPYASNASITSVSGPSSGELPSASTSHPILHTPLLVFHDQTPLLMLRSLSGMIELNQVEERTLGVETSFWIAVALTYLEFLEERESYLAALSD